MNIIPLAEAKEGNQYRIQKIRDEARLVHRLSSMGLLCGSTLTVFQNLPKQPVLIYARDTLVAIGREESRKITLEEEQK